MKKIIYSALFIFGLLNGYAQCWEKISARNGQSVSIKEDGSLWTWGYNPEGQLADGTTTNRNSPTLVAGNFDWKEITTGYNHMLGIKLDGSLWAWGSNSSGQLGNDGFTGVHTPIQIGTATNWAKVAGGAYHSLAIKTDGTLWAWGSNYAGELGDGTLVIKNHPIQIGTSTNWVSISAGQQTSFGIKADGTLWAWGSADYGQLGTLGNTTFPTQVGTDTNWTLVNAGYHHTVGIRTDGTLWTWGWNLHGQLGNNTNDDSYEPIQIGTGQWLNANAGGYHTAAIKSDGTLWTWGSNSLGQLGIGSATITSKLIPTQVGAGRNWVDIQLSYAHTLALNSNKNLFAFGYNDDGRLGLGDNQIRRSPAEVICTQLGSNDFTNNEGLVLYPNPTKHYLNVKASPNVVFVKGQIFDVTGKAVSVSVNGFEGIDIQTLQNGIYFLQITTIAETHQLKFVKI
ncbi:RCC1 domain-containing protein [Flavobacterium wongokense]|uniref:RCC1 domain-containing protein n=1 Tax=Flavobacterium wongokense TaxID=2910674 RepID=UPI001F16FC8E|nr:T9SS type A sorting domain-containing protein [Flavobacterium sp. WG47]MCF6133504.1 T9SS type A sorting domain-containing protein [Flavobacterium sp. WG47]